MYELLMVICPYHLLLCLPAHDLFGPYDTPEQCIERFLETSTILKESAVVILQDCRWKMET